MRAAVLSGKGGTGKTFVAVNLAAAAGKSVYIDCDVEEPNGRVFFKPEGVNTETVYSLLPQFDAQCCTGCRKCVDFCHFNALAYIKNKPMIFQDVCHSCGGCLLVCPENAVSEIKRPVGIVEHGHSSGVQVVTGVLNVGEASAVPVIKAALEKGKELDDNTTVIDCPPGSSCSVMESVNEADYCVLVVESTAFGFHNFRMVYELVRLLGKPCGVVLNKKDVPYEPLESFCRENSLEILAEIPYSEKLAELAANGKIAAEHDEQAREIFVQLLNRIGGELE
ncbi:MAG: ATP-binding protein [Oscillospiraceae bacterium]|nr:ATP-binding protein [Oscillospiraceae bacterium]